MKFEEIFIPTAFISFSLNEYFDDDTTKNKIIIFPFHSVYKKLLIIAMIPIFNGKIEIKVRARFFLFSYNKLEGKRTKKERVL